MTQYKQYVQRRPPQRWGNPSPTVTDLETTTLYYNDHMEPTDKFTEIDFIKEPLLALDACRYLANYTGRSDYLANLRVRLEDESQPLPGKYQLAGVLNFWLQDHLKATGLRVPTPGAPLFKNIFKLNPTPRKGVTVNVASPVEGDAELDRVVKVHPAGAASQNAGCLYVTDGKGYGENLYFGRIEPNGEFVMSSDCKGTYWEKLVLETLEALNTQGAAA